MASIPSEIVPDIFQYLSPHDLAIVAQVNKTWKHVVYSNTCWKPFCEKLWEIKRDSMFEFYHGLEIPAYARHMGEPSELCFADWLSFILQKQLYSTVPFCVLESSSYGHYLLHFKQVWRRMGRPCIHTTHHKWYDVFRGRKYLSAMSPSDQQRVFYRHCKFTVQHEVMDTNPYCYWLQKHICRSIPFTYSRVNPSDIPPKSTHPADIIAAQQKTHENKRIYYLNAYRQSVFERFETSIARLRVYGKTQFDKKALQWDSLFSNLELESAPPSE
jgi:hypothetical protein